MIFIVKPDTNPSVALDVSGYVKTNMIGFHAVTTSSGTTYSSGSRINGFNSVLHNLGGGYNSSTGYFTAPVAGYYFFSANAYMNSANDGFSIRKNSTNSTNGIWYAGHYHGNASDQLNTNKDGSISSFIELAAGDTVCLMVPNRCIIRNNYGGSYFCGYLIYAS